MGLVDYEETDTESLGFNAVRSPSTVRRSIAFHPHRERVAGVASVKTPARKDVKSINAAYRGGFVSTTPRKGVGLLKAPAKKEDKSANVARRGGFVGATPRKGVGLLKTLENKDEKSLNAACRGEFVSAIPRKGVGLLKTLENKDEKSLNAARWGEFVSAIPRKGVGLLETLENKDEKSLNAAHRGEFVSAIPRKGPTTSELPLINKPTSSSRPGIQLGTHVASPVYSSTADGLRKSSDPLFLEGEWRRTPGEVNAGQTITIEGVTKKVISMEDAMAHELSYKKKLQVLKKKTCNDLPNSSKAIQGEPSEIINTGTKRKVPPTNLACSAPQHAPELNTPQQSGRSTAAIYECVDCKLICSGPLHLQQHYLGRKHKAKLEELKILNGGVTVGTSQSCIQRPPGQSELQLYLQQASERSDPVIYRCEECNIICAGPFNMQQHYQGKKHKTRVGELKLQKDGDTEGMGPMKCKICNILCMGEYNLRQHLAGKKHAACLQAVGGNPTVNSLTSDQFNPH